jgi:hypothetical protein
VHGLTAEQIAELIEHIPDDELVSFQVRAGVLKEARQVAAGGPRYMSTHQAARVFGWSAREWRRWAEAGLLDEAFLEETERGRTRWRLGREACAAYAEERAMKGRRPPMRRTSMDALAITPTKSVRERKRNNPITRSIRRGPRKKKAA